MKIYFAIVEKQEEAKQLADAMLAQMEAGNVNELESITGKLIELTGESGFYLSEEDWNAMLKTTRQHYPDFAAELILLHDDVRKLNEIVDELPACVQETIRIAFGKKHAILELPMEDESV